LLSYFDKFFEIFILASKKAMTIQEMLSSVEDSRSKHGLRHSLSDALLMCIMAMMSGCQGYREIGRLVRRHQKEFQQSFRLLHKVPSHVTIRDVLQRLDFDKFSLAFNQWAQQYVSLCKSDTKAVDGKAIAGTAVNPHDSYQNFVSIVSVFASRRGIVLCCDKIENGKESEIPTVRQLIQALDVQGELFTLDALHCQKKR
jgi:hypothetical protein